MKLLKRISALIYPVRCPFCNEIIFPEELSCAECAEKPDRYTGNAYIKGADGFFAAYDYDEITKPAIVLMKRGICGNAPQFFGKAIGDLINGTPAAEADMIIPVPMHKRDLINRGCNQAALIARELSRETGIALSADNAVKTRKTAAQKTLTYKERQVNLKDAFDLRDPEAVRGKSIIVVDDVCTTGSTLEELTGLLKKHGADRIWCVCCCKVPDKTAENDSLKGEV